MTNKITTVPFPSGTLVKILDSNFHRARVAEYMGPLGPKGARVYRVLVARKPPMYVQVLEEQLEMLALARDVKSDGVNGTENPAS